MKNPRRWFRLSTAISLGFSFLFFGLIMILLVSCMPSESSQTPQPSLAIQTLMQTDDVATALDDIPCGIEQIPQAEFVAEREALVAHAIEAQTLENSDVIRALGQVPRHCFVPIDLQDMAYFDTALPIGYGQTISQPSLVAHMTELLALEPGDKVLEIGTGSGYQAAILAELGYLEVYSIEIVPELYERSTKVLNFLGYAGVHIMQGDGYYGWPEFAPFDGIIVTAAPDHLPAPLADQLAEGGNLIIPIGPPGWYQTLWKFVKVEGELVAYNMGGVRFVAFTGEGIETVSPTPAVDD